MRVLVLGGTGAMGSHVCKRLAARGNEVVCTTRRERTPESGIEYVAGDAHDPAFLDGLLEERWDAVVDFMVWSTARFGERCEGLLAAADQYVFVSSYRVYADSPIIREDSPRLLDVVDDPDYLATDEYALSKARCEDMLFCGGGSNWTIVRPAVTYDGAVGRLQLGVYEARDWLWRAVNGMPVPMPEAMLSKQATMTRGADVAEMIARLVGNPRALGEAFTVSGSDHMAWGEVAEAYRSVLPSFKVAPCGLEEFERARGGVYQIRYDRMFDRIVDNTKVLEVTDMDPSDLTPMREGLPAALRQCLERGVQQPGWGLQGRLDRIVGGCPSLLSAVLQGGPISAAKYLVRRVSR